MANLFHALQHINLDESNHAFSIYSSVKEQKLLNVPISKPMFIMVLSGQKNLGKNNELICQPGEFIFLSNSSAINMRNIPKDNHYLALLIEFDFDDFNGLQVNQPHKKEYYIGKSSPILETLLQQYVEVSTLAPAAVMSSRKRELLTLLCHLGHGDILTLLASTQFKDKLHQMVLNNMPSELTAKQICQQLGMSTSTLNRKLRQEGTSLQNIKDNAKLGLALHLLQSTQHSIGIIADKCGYQSQSRFTERFKQRFGLTPSALRKTKLID